MTTMLLIIAACCAFTAVLLAGITLALRSSAAYRQGVERAVRSPAVIALIGEPASPSLLVTGGIRGGGALASLRTRLSGPNGRGRLEIRAVKSGEALRFEILKFQGAGKVVDLLNADDAKR
jgi:hypothetical protein